MKHRLILCVAAASSLVLAACGGGDDDDAGSATNTAEATGAETAEATASATEPATDSAPAADSDGTSELRIGRAGSIDGWKGDNCLAVSSVSTNPLVYDTLVRIADDGQGTKPGLAEVVYDEAALTYTITVRDGAAFSDGSPVGADDVAFSIEQWRTGPISGGYYQAISGVEAIDDSTVLLTLAQPDTFLPNLFTWCTSTVYPADFAGMTEEEFFQKPIGAGPYFVAEWNNPGSTETIVLEPNPHHYNGTGGGSSVDRIVIESTLDQGQQMVAFEAGELDIVEGIDPFVAKDLDPAQVVSGGVMPANLLLLNTARPGLDDPAVRAAISQALDRDSLASLLEGYAEPATGVLPTNVPAWSQGSGGYTYDPEAAAAVLEPLGLSIDLLYDSSSTVFSAVAEVVAAQLGEAGLTVNLTGVDSATSFGRATSSDFDIVLLQAGAVSPTAFDPLGFLMVAYYPWTGADTTVITEQFITGTSTTDPAAQAAAIGTAQDDARTQNTVIGLYNYSQLWAVSTDVQGFQPFPYLVWYPDSLSKSS